MARLHLRALRRVRTPHQVVGVCDKDDQAGREFAELVGTTSYRALDALFAAARPDLVHVCTPAGLHFEPARQALRLGGEDEAAWVSPWPAFTKTPTTAAGLPAALKGRYARASAAASRQA